MSWCWSGNSNTLATWCEELTHWKRPWCWERLRAGGEGDDRGWDAWMASPTRWTWVSVDSGNWWWTGRSGMLQFMALQRVRHDWAIELNWTDNEYIYFIFRGENFVLIVRYIKSWVDQKSEGGYYVSFCGMNLILPQEMKLKEGRNCNNSNLVFKYLFSL